MGGEDRVGTTLDDTLGNNVKYAEGNIDGLSEGCAKTVGAADVD